MQEVLFILKQSPTLFLISCSVILLTFILGSFQIFHELFATDKARQFRLEKRKTELDYKIKMKDAELELEKFKNADKHDMLHMLTSDKKDS